MIGWKVEGKPLHQGLYFYKPNDPRSAGFCLRIGKHMWMVRYSKVAKKWFFVHIKNQ